MARQAKPSGVPPPDAQLDTQIDKLYQLPLDAFTSARNELAKSVAAAGDKAAAKEIKALAKPTVIPWAVNQVYWQARSIWTRLIEAGQELRAAQVEALERPGSNAAQVQRVRDQLRDATAAHRQAVADAVHQALRAATQARVNPQSDLLARMLDALSLAPPDRPGRLTEVVQPAGFEALFGVSPVAPAVFPRSAPVTQRAEPANGRPQSAQAARAGRPAANAAAERERAAELRAARESLKAAQDAEHEAQGTVEAAKAAVDDAELRVTQAKAALKSAEAGLKAAAAGRSAADAHLRRLDQRK